MRHRQVDPARADPLGPGPRPPVQDDARLRPPADLDLPPREVDPRAERLADRLLPREAARVEAILDVEASQVLTEAQKRRVVDRAGPTLRAVAQDERSQARNRELAVERLLEQLRAALRPVRPRRPTAPTGPSRERRLEEK